MAYRQYIGARYVPLYVGNWDASRNYEPLSIVTDANGNSFTSLKDVPKGTALNNRDYWVQTSSYSGAIDVLRRDVDALQTDVSGLQTDLAGVESDVEVIRKENVNSKRKYILIGDSYGTGKTAGGATVRGWAARFKEYLRLNDTNCFINCVDATGFIGQIATTFLTQLQTVAQGMTEEIKRQITDIVVCGGANDYNQTDSAIAQACRDFYAYAKTTFPNADVHVGCVGYNTNPNDSSQRNNMNKVAYAYGFMAGAHNLGTNIRYALALRTGYMSSDYLHPTEDGYLALARAIVSAVHGNLCINSGLLHDPSLSAPAGVTFNGGTGDWFERITESNYNLLVPNKFEFFGIGSTKPTRNEWFKLANFDAPIGHGLTAKDFMSKKWVCLLTFNNGGTISYRQDACEIAVSGNALWVRLTAIANGSWVTYENLTHITLLSGCYEFDLSYM